MPGSTTSSTNGNTEVEKSSSSNVLSVADQQKNDRKRLAQEHKEAKKFATQHQRELAADKKADEAKQNSSQSMNGSNLNDATKGFLPREWAQVEDNAPLEGPVSTPTISIMTWNMLAQSLVRRDLFPSSDFLKVKDRVPTLAREILYYNPDIVCLQEVDRLSDHLPHLTLTHGYSSYIGYPNKAHGLLIAYKNTIFTKAGELGIRLDELSVHSEEDDNSPRSSSDIELTANHRRSVGISRSTRNVALITALKFKSRPGGVIIATTHLFWHPKHVYERVRQTGLLMREVRRFRRFGLAAKESGVGEIWRKWPIFVAGDFNTQPCEATYRLLMQLPLSKAQEIEIISSSVVHESVDKLYNPEYGNDESNPASNTGPDPAEKGSTLGISAAQAEHTGDESIETEETDPDKVIKNSRQAVESDGIADLNTLRRLYSSNASTLAINLNASRVRSAYGEIHGKLLSSKGRCYFERPPEVMDGTKETVKEETPTLKSRQTGSWDDRVRRGDFEPMWTNFTPLWRCTLDYIFLLPADDISDSEAFSETPSPTFTALLNVHSTEEMGLGLPRRGIEPSDHVAIAAKVQIP